MLLTEHLPKLFSLATVLPLQKVTLPPVNDDLLLQKVTLPPVNDDLLINNHNIVFLDDEIPRYRCK